MAPSARYMSDQFNEDVPRVAPSSLAGVIDVPTVGVLITGLVRVLLVRVSVAVINETVPVTFGNVIVLSAVGSVIVNVVSYESAVDGQHVLRCIQKHVEESYPQLHSWANGHGGYTG